MLGKRKRTATSSRNGAQRRRYAINRVPRGPRPSGDDVHYFKRNCIVGTITSSTTVAVGSAYTFTLTNLPGYTEFTALFDQYRLLKVMMQFIPATNVLTASATPLAHPVAVTAIDYDDGNTPTTTDELREFETCKIVQPFKVHYVNVIPRIAAAVYSGAFTSFSNTKMWIDSASPTVQHYGVKFIADASTAVQIWHVECCYYVACRNSR